MELALIRLVEIAGEASAKVSFETQAKYPVTTWPQVIGMRNRLIHGYESVGREIVHRVIYNELGSGIISPDFRQQHAEILISANS
ncbi:MAG: DUF86 domain-containing protein [Desulfobacterales bacterium]